MSKGKSGQQIGAHNLQQLRKWINERDQSEDWADYWRSDKLRRYAIGGRLSTS